MMYYSKSDNIKKRIKIFEGHLHFPFVFFFVIELHGDPPKYITGPHFVFGGLHMPYFDLFTGYLNCIFFFVNVTFAVLNCMSSYFQSSR